MTGKNFKSVSSQYVLQSEVLNLQKSLGETKAEKEEYKRDMKRFQDLLEIEQKERQKVGV